MHKGFYASGFLYHFKSEQILLQQQISADKESQWTLFGCEFSEKETAEHAFASQIKKLLNLDLKPKDVFPIYKYFHEEMKKDHYLSYAKIGKLIKFPDTKTHIFSWFNFKQINKLKVSAQTKHDLVVAQRVIDSALRRKLGQQTID